MKIIIRKPFLNKRNQQLTVTIPKRELPKKLKYADDLFFALTAFRKAERRNKDD